MSSWGDLFKFCMPKYADAQLKFYFVDKCLTLTSVKLVTEIFVKSFNELHHTTRLVQSPNQKNSEFTVTGFQSHSLHVIGCKHSQVGQPLSPARYPSLHLSTHENLALHSRAAAVVTVCTCISSDVSVSLKRRDFFTRTFLHVSVHLLPCPTPSVF